jgi:hypothetical protein
MFLLPYYAPDMTVNENSILFARDSPCTHLCIDIESHPKLRAFGAATNVAYALHHKHVSYTFKMRRKRSDELPRFVKGDAPPALRWNRRYAYVVAAFIFVCWLLYPSRSASAKGSNAIINWSNYAYSLYATDSATLCHAVLIADALARLGSKADRVLFYPSHWDTVVSDSRDRDSQLLVLARDKYHVKLHPIELLAVGGITEGTYPALHTADPPLNLSL